MKPLITFLFYFDNCHNCLTGMETEFVNKHTIGNSGIYVSDKDIDLVQR